MHISHDQCSPAARVIREPVNRQCGRSVCKPVTDLTLRFVVRFCPHLRHSFNSSLFIPTPLSSNARTFPLASVNKDTSMEQSDLCAVAPRALSAHTQHTDNAAAACCASMLHAVYSLACNSRIGGTAILWSAQGAYLCVHACRYYLVPTCVHTACIRVRTWCATAA